MALQLRSIRVTGTGFVNTALDGFTNTGSGTAFNTPGPFTMKGCVILATAATATVEFRDGTASGNPVLELGIANTGAGQHTLESFDWEGGGFAFATSLHVTLSGCRVYILYG